MKFDEAYQHLIAGERIYRHAWTEEDSDGELTVRIIPNRDSPYHMTIIAHNGIIDGESCTKDDEWENFTSEDILADDWDVDEFPLTFLEAMCEAKNGKRVTNRTVQSECGKGSFYTMKYGQLLLFNSKHPELGTSMSSIGVLEVGGSWTVIE